MSMLMRGKQVSIITYNALIAPDVLKRSWEGLTESF
jgi:hypothetical protein